MFPKTLPLRWARVPSVTSKHRIPAFNHVICRRFASSEQPTPIPISSELIHGDDYDILRKEKSDRLTITVGSKMLHSLWISGGWLLPRNVDGDRLKSALQSALNVFPWISSRITNIDPVSYSLHCANQGIKFDTICHPELSINPSDGEKYDRLQRAVRPEQRNQFFTADKPHLLVRDLATTPIVTVQLNHLNVSNLDEVTPKTASILTFKLIHSVGDGFTGYLLMRYLSDYLSGRDLSEYNQANYGRLFDADESQQKALSEEFKDPLNFERKYNLKSDGSATYIMPNVPVVRQTRFQVILTKFFEYIMPYLVSMNMDYFELRFTPKDIDQIRNDLMNGFSDDHHLQNERLSTYECLTAYLSPLIAKYDSSTGLLKRILVPTNIRNRSPEFGNYSIGNLAILPGVGVEDENGSIDYNASNFALKLHETLGRYARAQWTEEMMQKIKSFYNDFVLMAVLHGPMYTPLPILEALKNQSVVWNEFRSMKLYDYRFGLDERPLLYMYGVSYTGNRFMMLEDPMEPKGVRVFIRMPKGKAKKMRKSETEFFNKYEVSENENSFTVKESV